VLGGRTGAEIRSMVGSEETPIVTVPIRGETRTFVGVRETDTGRSLLLNPGGPLCFPDEVDDLFDVVERTASEISPSWIACCGSLPPGFPADTYARIGDIAASAGARFVADCDGEALRHAAARGCDLLVPNHHEAGRLLGSPVEDIAAAVDAAVRLVAQGTPVVSITLGALGAVAADRTGVWHAAAPPAVAGSAVGAGDAFLAGLLLGLESNAAVPEALQRATAAGSAALMSRGTSVVGRDDAGGVLATVRVEQLR
jgi:1-phosphofructokinase family hexose kinase